MSRRDLDTLEPAVVACLDRTRSAVLNVMVVAAAGIAVSGLVLRRRDRGALAWPLDDTRRLAYSLLLVIVTASIALRRGLGRRSALNDPSRRCTRFFRAHVLAVTVGALAVPLGLAHGIAAEPSLQAVAPFWVAALALGALAFPRARELEDFDEPMISDDQRPSEAGS